VVFLP